AANADGGANTIIFAPGVSGQTITLSSHDTNNPFAFGPTALVIEAGDKLTIEGSPTVVPGVTISGGNAQRIFGVFAGASLTIAYVRLAGGKAQGGAGGTNGGAGGGGGGGAGLGGAIFNDGSLNLIASTLTGNTAAGGNGGAGGRTGSLAGAGGGSA